MDSLDTTVQKVCGTFGNVQRSGKVCLFIFAKHKRSWRDVVTVLKMWTGTMHLSESVVERMTSEVPVLQQRTFR